MFDALDNLKSVHRAEGTIENKDERMPVVGKDVHVTLYSYNLSGILSSLFSIVPSALCMLFRLSRASNIGGRHLDYFEI